VGMTYDQSALAGDDARGYFLLMAAKATLQTVAFLVGIQVAGLAGALIGQGIALAVAHPLIVVLARRHGAWDALHDGVMSGGVAVLIAWAVWWNWTPLLGLHF
jgi:hypothetical protein